MHDVLESCTKIKHTNPLVVRSNRAMLLQLPSISMLPFGRRAEFNSWKIRRHNVVARRRLSSNYALAFWASIVKRRICFFNSAWAFRAIFNPWKIRRHYVVTRRGLCSNCAWAFWASLNPNCRQHFFTLVSWRGGFGDVCVLGSGLNPRKIRRHRIFT